MAGQDDKKKITICFAGTMEADFFTNTVG